MLKIVITIKISFSHISFKQQIHNEAIQMRDATKIILMRQEHAAHVSTRSRERQAFDFRRQVEERKAELERLERKLFSTGLHFSYKKINYI